MAQQKPLWFKTTRYHYGPFPATWQGFTVVVLWGMIIIALSAPLQTAPPNIRTSVPLWWLASVIVVTVILIVITVVKGEKDCWRLRK